MTRVMAAVAEAQREGEAHVVQAMHEKRAASLYAQVWRCGWLEWDIRNPQLL